jgi:S-adenosyl methyltransferase
VSTEGESAGLQDGKEPGEPDPKLFDTGIAHPARVYNYWLGGKDNYAADREAAEQAIAANPNILPGVQANRAFLRRAVQYLAGEAGIRQFLDIGTGLPTARTRMRWPSRSRRSPGSCTWTTTRSCWPTPGPC